MYATVITDERSTFGANGLTYESPAPITVGTLVEIPLRKKTVAGVVIKTSDQGLSGGIDVRRIKRVLRTSPVLTEWQLSLMRWMCEYYYCTPRQALQVLLPTPPWKLLADKESASITLIKPDVNVRGKKQQAIIKRLRECGIMEESLLIKEAKASTATLATLLEQKIVQKTMSTVGTTYEERKMTHLDELDLAPPLRNLVTEMQKHHAILFCTHRAIEDRVLLYASIARSAWNEGKSSLILLPTVTEAVIAKDECCRALPDAEIVLAHGQDSPAVRRRRYDRLASEKPLIIVGTRTALFLPIHKLGVVIIDREHDRSWKSDQAPRYHARLTAEVIARSSGAKLILSSPTPSLDTLQHTIAKDGVPSRLTLIDDTKDRAMGDVRMIDLTEAAFGKVYPFTTPLIDLLHDRLQKKEVSVLLLNRRGTGSSMLCFGCKRPIANHANIALSVITRNGAPWLLDSSTGEMLPTPELCPACGSTELRTIGAGTERIEEIVHVLIPDARVLRLDADTIDHASAMRSALHALDKGAIDIVLGTQAVLPALRSDRVTLVGVLIADIGLSVPDFRAGERVFALLSDVIAAMRHRGLTVIQTFRKDAPEIAHAIHGTSLAYLRQELALRERTGYPPASQLIDLIIRRDHKKAQEIMAQAQAIGKEMNVSATLMENHDRRTFQWTVRLRGAKARDALRRIRMTDIIVNVDPIE